MDEPPVDDPLVETTDRVRRVIGARLRDVQLVEDLTQETLVRVAAARDRLDDEALGPYAVVTARSLIADHLRAQAMHGRHVHRLVEYRGFEGPEQLALEREETDALAVALDRLGADERTLLLRHETEGVDLDTLADEEHTTRGAVRMRLARARATLRLEFLLAFRHVSLPTDRCRAVLLAISAGDRRRQHRLDAAAHLRRCSTCAELARPVGERNRGIAGWLIIPAAEAVRRAVGAIFSSRPAKALRTSRAAQAATILGAGAAVTVGVIVAGAGDESPQANPPPAQSSVAQPTAPRPTPATIQPTSPPPSRNTIPPATSVDAAGCAPLAPLGEGSPAERVGCPFAPTALMVDRVPADEGFWVEAPGGGRLWVYLVGSGESPVNVRAGRAIGAQGRIVAPPGDLGQIGLEPSDARRVQRQGFYLEVHFSDITRR